MAYKPFALKYRPQTFEDIVGQEHVSQTLRNAVAQGRVSHAYVFSGPRGTGKTSTARVLAKALNCVDGPTPRPCGVCEACVSIQEGRYLDVIEIDAASNRGIDDIRSLRERVTYGPATGRCKVYILDEAHQITKDAFNAFLKTLEEPPPQTYFIMATTEAHRFPDTIMSRCQRFDFRAIPPVDIVATLRSIADEEGVEIEDAALWTLAEAAAGAMRDAESIFDKVVAYTSGTITRDTVAEVLGLTQAELLETAAGLVADEDLAGLFALVDQLVGEGKDLAQFLQDFVLYGRDLLRLELGAQPPPSMEAQPAKAQAARELAGKLGRERLQFLIGTFTHAQQELRRGAQEILTAELALAAAATGPPEPVVVAAPPAESATPPARPETPASSPGPPEPRQTAPPASRPRRPRPAAAPPPVAGDLTLEAVRERWENMLPEQLKRSSAHAAYAMCREARLTALEGDSLHLLFPPQCEFHYDGTRNKYRSAIEEALAALVGKPLTLVCHLEGRGEGPPPATPAPESAAPAESPPAAEQPPAPEQAPDTADNHGATDAQPQDSSAPAPREPGEALDQAVSQTLELFSGSHEISEEQD